MPKARDELRDRLSIFSPHNACKFAKERGGTGVYLGYRTQVAGRGFISAAWQVVGINFETNPDAHFQDYGAKTFTVGLKRDRATAEQEAREWAAEKYGITEWVKVPGLPGALFAKRDAEIIKAALREARKESA